MTNNIDRAAEVIRQVDGDHTLGAGALAEALFDAGLLTPDLPEMDEQWRLLRDHNAEAWHVLDEVQHAKAMGRKTIRIDELLGDTDE